MTKPQQEAYNRFKDLKVGSLFMEQGTGKTRVALELIEVTDSDYCLFVAPYSTLSNLDKEINKWGLSKPYELIGYETISMSDYKFMDLLERLEEYKKIFVIADESIFIKNEDTKRFNRMLYLRDLSEYRLILNGTPLTKDEWDIYNQMEFLSPLIIGMARDEFLNTFFKKITYKKKGEKEKSFHALSEVNVDYLKRLIEPYIFRVSMNFTKRITEKSIMILPSEEELIEYQERKRQLLANIMTGEHNLVAMLSNLSYQTYVSNNRLIKIANYIQSNLNEQIIIYCSYLKEIDTISSLIDCYVITGDTKDRDKILNDFRNDNKPLLMTYGVGSFGLNLQFVHKMAFISLMYDYGKMEQSKARIKRLGQERDIIYYYFDSPFGIHNMIKENIKKKRNLSDLMIEEIKKVI